jgi:hypothetical protein
MYFFTVRGLILWKTTPTLKEVWLHFVVHLSFNKQAWSRYLALSNKAPGPNMRQNRKKSS